MLHPSSSSVTLCIVAKRCVLEKSYYWQPTGICIWEIDWYQNEWPWPLFRGRTESCQPLRYIRRWISRKPLEIEARFGSKEPPIGTGHVTDDVAWPQKVLWGSTAGYPSDSLASCVYYSQSHRRFKLADIAIYHNRLTDSPPLLASQNTFSVTNFPWILVNVILIKFCHYCKFITIILEVWTHCLTWVYSYLPNFMFSGIFNSDEDTKVNQMNASADELLLLFRFTFKYKN